MLVLPSPTDLRNNVSLNDLAKEIHATAAEKGFWDKDRNMGEMLMLMTSELAEALEEHRASKPDFYLEPDHIFPPDCTPAHYLAAAPETQALAKPEGLAVELADCLIRILDTLAARDIDIDALVRAKMAYNSSREFMHGKKY